MPAKAPLFCSIKECRAKDRCPSATVWQKIILLQRNVIGFQSPFVLALKNRNISGVERLSFVMTKLGNLWTAKTAFLAATALVMSPAIAAGLMVDSLPRAASLDTMIGRFTPASGDPRLIERLSKVSHKSRSEFRFTPVLGNRNTDSRALTVVVRAPATTSALRDRLKSVSAPTVVTQGPTSAAPVAIAPVAYNLGSKLGFERFAVTDKTKLDLAALPKAKLAKGPAPKPSRIGTEMRIDSVETVGTERPLDGERAVEVDFGTSYKLTRNLKVTAGVRYKQEDDRLKPMTDERRDSQAVYVGTQIRF